MNRTKRSSVIAAAVGITLVAGIGVAWSQIPGTDGVIHACYTKSGGSLRVIDSSQTCGNKETSLNWNQTGPQGPKGDPGATGPSGPAGPTGPAGPALGVSGRELAISHAPVNCDDQNYHVISSADVHLSRPSLIYVSGLFVASVPDQAPQDHSGFLVILSDSSGSQVGGANVITDTVSQFLGRDAGADLAFPTGDYTLSIQAYTSCSGIDFAVTYDGLADQYVVMPAA